MNLNCSQMHFPNLLQSARVEPAKEPGTPRCSGVRQHLSLCHGDTYYTILNFFNTLNLLNLSRMDFNFFFYANEFLLFNTNTKEEKLLCLFRT